jgi:hypothetical protein
MKDDGRFIDSDRWKQMAEKVDSVALATQKEAALRLTEGDLRDLLGRVESNSEKEQYAALGMLLMAARGNNVSLGPLLGDLREKAAQLAKGWMIEDPPQTSDKAAVMRYAMANFSGNRPPDVGYRAYALLAVIDNEAAAQFLVSHFPYEALTPHAKEEVLHQFAERCAGDKARRSDTALKRLIDIAQKGEPEAKKAAAYLIGRQLLRRSEVEKITEKWRATPPDELSPSAVAEFIAEHPKFSGQEEKLRKQATDWRKTKSIASLNRLYYDFLETIPEGASMEPLLAILGAPNWWDPYHEHGYNFSSEEGPALQIHLWTDGKLGGIGGPR